MLAWEWNIEKAREEEESEKKKAASRKISQTAQVLGWFYCYLTAELLFAQELIIFSALGNL